MFIRIIAPFSFIGDNFPIKGVHLRGPQIKPNVRIGPGGEIYANPKENSVTLKFNEDSIFVFRRLPWSMYKPQVSHSCLR